TVLPANALTWSRSFRANPSASTSTICRSSEVSCRRPIGAKTKHNPTYRQLGEGRGECEQKQQQRFSVVHYGLTFFRSRKIQRRRGPALLLCSTARFLPFSIGVLLSSTALMPTVLA